MDTAGSATPAVADLQPFWPADPVASPHRVAKHALAAQLRSLAAAVVQLDVESVAPDVLTGLVDAASSLRAAVEAEPTYRGRGNAALSGTADASLFERSPLSGRSNALAAPLSLRFTDGLTRGHAVYGDAYEGPPGLVHGGYVISAFDDLLGVAQMASGIAGYTGELTVRLRRGTPLHARIDYEAGVERTEGRKIWAWGRSTLDGTLLAEATGLFISPRPA